MKIRKVKVIKPDKELSKFVGVDVPLDFNLGIGDKVKLKKEEFGAKTKGWWKVIMIQTAKNGETIFTGAQGKDVRMFLKSSVKKVYG